MASSFRATEQPVLPLEIQVSVIYVWKMRVDAKNSVAARMRVAVPRPQKHLIMCTRSSQDASK